MRYRVRYLAPDGKEKSKSFPDKKKREAQAFLASMQADILRGTYVDPDAGRITFRRYTDAWLAAATTDELTRDRLEYEFRLHVYPTMGHLPLTSIQPATIREWAHKLQQSGLAASYRRVLFNDVSMIFNAAVDDRKVVSNPFAVKTIRPLGWNRRRSSHGPRNCGRHSARMSPTGTASPSTSAPVADSGREKSLVSAPTTQTEPGQSCTCGGRSRLCVEG
ncbi:hypothetical protein [Jidongwangia harbinensis]|uniref:hypothetical protein n=1 Tax=Jidongwangia harbinensis TaxID=2878561 RepID=UPI001CDA0985|nr:hypothetical protein [Jidongwangia harbinensis]MCA2219376.1 hypothetical protein [Jidongwangia harbinensis]